MVLQLAQEDSQCTRVGQSDVHRTLLQALSPIFFGLRDCCIGGKTTGQDRTGVSQCVCVCVCVCMHATIATLSSAYGSSDVQCDITC